MRPTAIARTDIVSRPPQAAEIQLRETFTLLKEKTELMRRHVLAVEGETAAAMAMRGDLIEGAVAFPLQLLLGLRFLSFGVQSPLR